MGATVRNSPLRYMQHWPTAGLNVPLPNGSPGAWWHQGYKDRKAWCLKRYGILLLMHAYSSFRKIFYFNDHDVAFEARREAASRKLISNWEQNIWPYCTDYQAEININATSAARLISGLKSGRGTDRRFFWNVALMIYPWPVAQNAGWN